MTDERGGCQSVDAHECDHDCDCFWCRVSRRDAFPTVTDTMTVGDTSSASSPDQP